jgi:hypothetical protein
MTGHRLEVADVFHAHQNQFLQRWGHVVSDQQRKVLRDIGRCRTAGFVKIRHFGLLANRNRRQALALRRIHLHATTPDISALLTEPQKSALNRSCPQCKRGTLHDTVPRRTLVPPTPPHASNRLPITSRSVAAVPRIAQAHRRTDLLRSPPSDFVPSQPRQLTANSIQSPYFYRASALLQIAVSALLRTDSVGAREVLAAEHCRYGTRDFAPSDAAAMHR